MDDVHPTDYLSKIYEPLRFDNDEDPNREVEAELLLAGLSQINETDHLNSGLLTHIFRLFRGIQLVVTR